MSITKPYSDTSNPKDINIGYGWLLKYTIGGQMFDEATNTVGYVSSIIHSLPWVPNTQ